DLVVDHIEKHWCPTITSADFLGGDPFQFAADRRSTVAMVIGENEYRTWLTLPAFAREELLPRNLRMEFVLSSTNLGDPRFSNWPALRRASLVVVRARRAPGNARVPARSSRRGPAVDRLADRKSRICRPG
ncbi:MAG: hypothetical protein ACYDC1_15995, partial [Limisphaerales bacterium]